MSGIAFLMEQINSMKSYTIVLCFAFSVAVPIATLQAQGLSTDIASVNSELFQTLLRYQASSGRQKAQAGADLRSIAVRRKQLMRELAVTNPERFLQSVLPESKRRELPAEVRSETEALSVLEGKIEMLHRDDFANRRSYNSYAIRVGGEKVSFHPVGKAPFLPTGSTVRANAWRLGDEAVTPAADNTIQVIQPAPRGQTTGRQRLLAVLVQSRDAPSPALSRNVRRATSTPPQVLNLTRRVAAIGDRVGIVGSGFSRTGNTLLVGFPDGSGESVEVPNVASPDGFLVEFDIPSSLRGRPIATGTYLISLGNERGTSSPAQLFVSNISVSPPSGSFGSVFTITGRGFALTPRENTLIAAFPTGERADVPRLVSEEGVIRIQVPSGIPAGLYKFRILNVNGLSEVNEFTVISDQGLGAPPSVRQPLARFRQVLEEPERQAQAESPLPFSRNLSCGLRNDPEVRRLQELLIRLGCYRGEAHGAYDGPTATAVYQCQVRNGIPPEDANGCAFGPRTRAIANAVLAREAAAAAVPPAPAGSSSLEVALDPSSPPTRQVAAGTTDVPLTVLRISAQGEDVDLAGLGLQFDGSNRNALENGKFTVWDGAIKIGEGTFVGRNTVGVVLQPRVLIPGGSQRSIVITANLAPTGTNQPARIGDTVGINYDGDAPQLTNGVGRSSATTAYSTTRTDTNAARVTLSTSTLPPFSGVSLTGVNPSSLDAGRQTTFNIVGSGFLPTSAIEYVNGDRTVRGTIAPPNLVFASSTVLQWTTGPRGLAADAYTFSVRNPGSLPSNALFVFAIAPLPPATPGITTGTATPPTFATSIPRITSIYPPSVSPGAGFSIIGQSFPNPSTVEVRFPNGAPVVFLPNAPTSGTSVSLTVPSNGVLNGIPLVTGRYQIAVGSRQGTSTYASLDYSATATTTFPRQRMGVDALPTAPTGTEPDLAVVSIGGVDVGPVARVNTPIQIRAIVQNLGGTASAAVTGRYSIRFGNINGQVVVAETPFRIGALHPGADSAFTGLFTFFTPGQYFIRACADAAAGETATVNNCDTRVFPIDVPGEVPEAAPAGRVPSPPSVNAAAPQSLAASGGSCAAGRRTGDVLLTWQNPASASSTNTTLLWFERSVDGAPFALAFTQGFGGASFLDHGALAYPGEIRYRVRSSDTRTGAETGFSNITTVPVCGTTGVFGLNLPPVLRSVSPSRVTANTPTTFVISGENFSRGALIHYVGADNPERGVITPTFVSANELQVIGRAVGPGVWNFWIKNPTSIESGAITVVASAPATAGTQTPPSPASGLSLTEVNPSTLDAGRQITFNITGRDFQPATVIEYANRSGTVRGTIAPPNLVFVSSTVLQWTTGSRGLAADTYTFSVRNPGGSPSNVLTVTVNPPSAPPAVNTAPPQGLAVSSGICSGSRRTSPVTLSWANPSTATLQNTSLIWLERGTGGSAPQTFATQGFGITRYDDNAAVSFPDVLTYRIRYSSAVGNFTGYSSEVTMPACGIPPSSAASSPSAPQNLATSGGVCDASSRHAAVTLSWANPSSVSSLNTNLVRLERSVGSSAFSTLSALGFGATNFTDGGSVSYGEALGYRAFYQDFQGNPSGFSNTATLAACQASTLPRERYTPVATSTPQTAATCTVSFTPNAIAQGESSRAEWRSNDSDGRIPYTCTGDLAGGTLQYTSGWLIVSPRQSQSCTLEVENSAGTASCQAAISVAGQPAPAPAATPSPAPTPPPPPSSAVAPSCSVSFAPDSISLGQSTRADWSSNDSDSRIPYTCTGDLPAGTLSSASGSLTVSPRQSQSCTLEVANTGGTAYCRAAVTVAQPAASPPPPPPPPPTCYIYFSPHTVQLGQPSTAIWSSNDSDGQLSYSCGGNVGSGAISPASGSVNVVPNATQTCTLTTANAQGATSCSATVTVTNKSAGITPAGSGSLAQALEAVSAVLKELNVILSGLR